MFCKHTESAERNEEKKNTKKGNVQKQKIEVDGDESNQAKSL